MVIITHNHESNVFMQTHYHPRHLASHYFPYLFRLSYQG